MLSKAIKNNIRWPWCIGWAIIIMFVVYFVLTAFIEWQWNNNMYSLDWLWRFQEIT
jgi:hypothetical protein